VSVEELLAHVDRFAGGRHAAYRISEPTLQDPRTARTWRTVGWLLVVTLLVAASAVAEAALQHLGGNDPSNVVWMRLLVILGMTVSLFYFLLRARQGYWWAYSRLRLFSMIFPVVAVVTSAIPGLYPMWMIVEQITFAAILVALTVQLGSAHMREVYAKPTRADLV
jgi:cation transport ATPase